jgi:hypothetical protein
VGLRGPNGYPLSARHPKTRAICPDCRQANAFVEGVESYVVEFCEFHDGVLKRKPKGDGLLSRLDGIEADVREIRRLLEGGSVGE